MSKADKEDIKKKILKIITSYSNREYKYRRNATEYLYTPINSLDDMNTEAGFYETNDKKSSLIQENIIYSTISALVAKIAEHSKARPFINTVKGNNTDNQTAKELQHFFDLYFDSESVYHKVSLCFRDACIFDTGYILVDNENKHIENVKPWQVFYQKNELRYDKPRQVLIMQRQYPTSLVEDYKGKKDTVTLLNYWSLKDKKHYTLMKEDPEYFREVDYDFDELPVLSLTYDDYLVGTSSTSVVDLLYGIQQKVDEILRKIGLAAKRNFGSIFLVPTVSDIKVDKLTSEVGQVVSYTPINGTNAPIEQMTEPIIDSQYFMWYQQLINEAHDLVGISETSVTGDKPVGDVSGKALNTLEDIEADRFQTQLNKVIKLYVDLAKKIIALYDGTVLPKTKDRKGITWSQVRKVNDKMSIQFSAATSLSKDPAKKYDMIRQMAADGLLPQSRIPGLLDMPDLELAGSFAANSQNAIQAIIADCIDNNKYDIPPYVSYEELKPEIINACLQFRGLDDDESRSSIKKLEKLYETVLEKQKEVGDAQNQDEASAVLDEESNNMDYLSNLADMQAQQMTSIANDLQNGVISQEQAQSMLDSMAMQE